MLMLLGQRSQARAARHGRDRLSLGLHCFGVVLLPHIIPTIKKKPRSTIPSYDDGGGGSGL
ncbi:MAG: hypothetical protein ACE1Y1_08505, partial [Nitrosomonadaceae bacterium]